MPLLLILLLLLTSTPATADTGRPDLTPASCPTEKSSPAFSLLSDNTISALGSEAADNRISLEKKGEIAALSVLTPSPFSPYIGAGLNKNDRAETALEALANREQTHGYELGAGVGCALGDRASLGLDYRYTPAADSILLRTFPTSDEERHRISLGLEIHF